MVVHHVAHRTQGKTCNQRELYIGGRCFIYSISVFYSKQSFPPSKKVDFLVTGASRRSFYDFFKRPILPKISIKFHENV